MCSLQNTVKYTRQMTVMSFDVCQGTKYCQIHKADTVMSFPVCHYKILSNTQGRYSHVISRVPLQNTVKYTRQIQSCHFPCATTKYCQIHKADTVMSFPVCHYKILSNTQGRYSHVISRVPIQNTVKYTRQIQSCHFPCATTKYCQIHKADTVMSFPVCHYKILSNTQGRYSHVISRVPLQNTVKYTRQIQSCHFPCATTKYCQIHKADTVMSFPVCHYKILSNTQGRYSHVISRVPLQNTVKYTRQIQSCHFPCATTKYCQIHKADTVMSFPVCHYKILSNTQGRYSHVISRVPLQNTVKYTRQIQSCHFPCATTKYCQIHKADTVMSFPVCHYKILSNTQGRYSHVISRVPLQNTFLIMFFVVLIC